MKYYLTIAIFLATMFAACTTGTGEIGVVPDNEQFETDFQTFGAVTYSTIMKNVKANASDPYLGCIYDPETKTRIESSFATQFAIVEGSKLFPESKYIASCDPVTGKPVCDTVMLQLSFNRYFGDKNAPLKISVYRLKPSMLVEGKTYYTDTDLSGFRGERVGTQVVTVYDRNGSIDPDDTNASSYPSIRIALDKSVGDGIMEKYYSHREYFQDSYQFIKNVMPGFLVEVENGEGFMINVFVDALYIGYRQYNEGTSGETAGKYTSFAGTQEVIQTCQIRHELLESLCDDANAESSTRSLIKTPAGVHTVMRLPIDEIYAAEHVNDSVSKVEFVLQRYINGSQDINYFSIPQNLLLLRKGDYDAFFAQNKIPDNVTSFIAPYSASYNTYQFKNIAELVSRLKRADKSVEGWNEVYLVPVTVTSNASTGAVSSVSHDFSLGSAQLVRGTEKNPIRLQVYYSRVKEVR